MLDFASSFVSVAGAFVHEAIIIKAMLIAKYNFLAIFPRVSSYMFLHNEIRFVVQAGKFSFVVAKSRLEEFVPKMQKHSLTAAYTKIRCR
ncbi:hypothetical protein [Asticcacaulis benevestitus]|uniref:Uncharacterized protein n=1 Tax=Asticcacaulis benevestitus DSM 16100 = ATCC BAA-896 TaxID=1121022 RepID=V4P974_9CAUL|nr:hypothetical protein [Asticcacaulis benevestitus]ESQ83624.1 hypothetical protein ABENE_20140 [Asticcacaulis benevestitus DSM 16100 = ATCC BAA-896]